MQEDTYRATVLRAAQLVGGPVELARRLQVPMADLTRWLAGEDRPSMGTFLKVIDIVLEETVVPRFNARNPEEDGPAEDRPPDR